MLTGADGHDKAKRSFLEVLCRCVKKNRVPLWGVDPRAFSRQITSRFRHMASWLQH